MTNPQIQAWLDQEDTFVAQTIRRYGVFIQYVSGDPAEVPESFAYTVGLFGLGHPELVVTDITQGTAHGLLNEVSGRVKVGGDLVPGELLTFDKWPHRVVVEKLPNPGEVVFAANRHYQRPPEASVPALVLTYDDVDGNFPWDRGYCNPPAIQPRPGTWSA